MRRIRSKLTYANVISTGCLFLLVGGGTAVAVTSSSGQPGNGSGAVFARIAHLPQSQGQPGFGAVSGIGAAEANYNVIELTSPNEPIRARDLSVRLSTLSPNEHCSGVPNCARSFVLLRDARPTALSCTVSGNERTCDSGSKSVLIPAGSRLVFRTALLGGDNSVSSGASLAWRATIP